MKKTMGIILICTTPFIAGLVIGAFALLRWPWCLLTSQDVWVPWNEAYTSVSIIAMIGVSVITLTHGIIWAREN